MAECGGLENRWVAIPRGFESLALRSSAEGRPLEALGFGRSGAQPRDGSLALRSSELDRSTSATAIASRRLKINLRFVPFACHIWETTVATSRSQRRPARRSRESCRALIPSSGRTRGQPTGPGAASPHELTEPGVSPERDNGERLEVLGNGVDQRHHDVEVDK